MKLYLAVTPDEYELPIAVEENYIILAKKFNVSVGTLLSSISHEASGKDRGVRFIRVDVEEDEIKDEPELEIEFTKYKGRKRKWFSNRMIECDMEL